VREEFHLLPLPKQQDLADWAEVLYLKGQVLTLLYVDRSGEGLEVSIRIDKNFDVPVIVSF